MILESFQRDGDNNNFRPQTSNLISGLFLWTVRMQTVTLSVVVCKIVTIQLSSIQPLSDVA